jgi:hypothetical protein
MMRKLIYSLIFVVALVALPSAKSGDLLQFKETTFDFGTISDTSAPVVHEYEFVNTADESVAVLSVSTGCGCTRPKYPTEPIKAGKKNKITVTFLPAGQSGEINKDIKVRYRGATAGSSKRITLRLRGVVTPSK